MLIIFGGWGEALVRDSGAWGAGMGGPLVGGVVSWLVDDEGLDGVVSEGAFSSRAAS